MPCFSLRMQYAVTGGWCDTCSLTSDVWPYSSSQLPRNNSPRNGLRGFFSDPSFSDREQYCCLRVLSSHFVTKRDRLAGSGSRVGAMNRGVFSVQYAENSTRDWVLRMKAGAVRDDRSPLKEAIDWDECQYRPGTDVVTC